MGESRIGPARVEKAWDGRTVALRSASAEDVAAVVAIERESFGDPWTQASFQSLLSNQHVHFAVATHESVVVGYLVAWFVLDEAEIANLAVSPSVRGRRVGARLLDEALEEARRRETASIFLEVRDSNTRARALYASRNFREVGRRLRYYRKPVEDAVVMRYLVADAGDRRRPHPPLQRK